MKAIKLSSLPSFFYQTCLTPSLRGALRDVAIFSLWCFLTLLVSTNTALAQKQLTIGDTLPDIIINDLLKPHAPKTTTQLYKKGALIISFWATWCKPCIAEMELLAKEVEKHEGNLSVVCMGYEPKAVVAEFLDKHPDIKNSALIVTSNDTLFKKLFFHQVLPHNIWIDQKGIVKAITSTDQVTEIRISQFLENSNITMRIKKESPFDWNKPAQIPDSLLGFRAIFSKELPGVSLSGAVISPGKLGKPNMTRFFAFNMLIINLFYKAWQMPGAVANMDLLEVQTLDSSRYFWPGVGKDKVKYTGISRAEWGINNRYTYELRVHAPVADNIFFQKVINDLEFNFNIRSYQEMRKKLCRVVTYTSNQGNLRLSISTDKYKMGIITNELVISNVPIDYLLDKLVTITARHKRKEPYVNESGLKGNVTATIDLGPDPKKYDNPEHLEKCLTEQTGLRFTVKNHKYPVMILKDATIK